MRAADEFRIQITNGPSTLARFDTDGAVDLLIGYSRDRDAIVSYDRRWLENWSRVLRRCFAMYAAAVQRVGGCRGASHEICRTAILDATKGALPLWKPQEVRKKRGKT